MQDGIIKGTGNSRYLKSNISADTTLSELIAMLRAGTFPVDLNGINEAGWQQLATALNKANLLSDATAAKFGTGVDTVDGTLGLLGDMHIAIPNVVGRLNSELANDFVWKVTSNEQLYDTSEPAFAYFCGGGATMHYSDQFEIVGGNFKLLNEQTFYVPSYSSDAAFSVLKGKYTNASSTSGGVSSLEYVPEDAYFSRNQNDYSTTFSTLSNIHTVSTFIKYVNSQVSDAYPPTVDDGYTYTALGRIGASMEA